MAEGQKVTGWMTEAKSYDKSSLGLWQGEQISIPPYRLNE